MADIINFFVSIIVIITGAIMWHMGGQGYKVMRLLVGLIIAIGKFAITLSPYTFLYAALLPILVSSFSYGLKSIPHKLMVYLFKRGGDGNDPEVEFATRCLCGAIWSLAAIVFVIFGSSTIPSAILYSIAATGLVGIFGVNKDVTTSELGTGAAVSLAILV